MYPGATEQLAKLANLSGVDKEQLPQLLKQNDLLNKPGASAQSQTPMVTIGLGQNFQP